MASCSLGTSNFKVSSFNFCREKHCVLRPCVSLAIKECKTLKYGSSVKSQLPSISSSAVCCGSVLDIPCSQDKYSGSVSNLVPNIEEVETLITNLCDTTSIVEIDLRLAGFQLHVVRNLNGKHEAAPPSPPPIIENTTQSHNSNGQLLLTSLAIDKLSPSYSLEVVPTFLDKAADAGLAIIQSPRVGYFRRSRTIKGKRAPPSCKEKQMVKEGQVICYIEQLGGELPIESDVSGEVIRILRQDGEPVGYGDALIAILPSFPGIKKLQ